MNKKLVFWLFTAFGIVNFFACHRKHVCPAYHSAFILDEKQTQSLFSQFAEDDSPKGNTKVDKDHHGIVKKMNKQAKQNKINNVRMAMVYPPPADTILMAGNNMEGNADSAYSSVQKPSYNREQEIYMRFIGQHYDLDLLSPSNEPALEEPDTITEEADTITEEPAKKKRGLFRNRNKKEIPETPEEDAEGSDPLPGF